MDGGFDDGLSVPDADAEVQFDRLVGLSGMIPAALVRDVLRDTDRDNPRACLLSHEVTTWLLLGMGILTDLPIRSVYQHARRLHPGETIPTRSALCQARRRLGIAPIRGLFQRVVRPLTDEFVTRRVSPNSWASSLRACDSLVTQPLCIAMPWPLQIESPKKRTFMAALHVRRTSGSRTGCSSR